MVGRRAKLFPYPAATAGGAKPLIVGGDAAVLMRDSEAGRALIEFLATPAAAAAWVERGGFLSPNRELGLRRYPDAVTRSIARQLIGAGDGLRFDLSDLQPAAFGATGGIRALAGLPGLPGESGRRRRRRGGDGSRCRERVRVAAVSTHPGLDRMSETGAGRGPAVVPPSTGMHGAGDLRRSLAREVDGGVRHVARSPEALQAAGSG